MFNIGVIGCGRISGQYLENFKTMFSGVARIVACSDLDIVVAETVAEEYEIEAVCTPHDLIARDDVEVVLNLTNPWAHADVNETCLNGGKHVYAEKPLAMNREDARGVLSLAAEKSLRFGCAPDTFLGAGLQTCIKLVDDGWIGTPTAVYGCITMPGAGLDARYHSAGIGGVLLDMSPYYLTAMVSLFGPVKRVAGFSVNATPTRSVWDMRKAEYGDVFDVEVPTTVCGTLEFDHGVFGHITATVSAHAYGPELKVVGTDGVLECNDPNMFGGPVVLRRQGSEPREIPLSHQYDNRNRGVGLVEMMLAEDHGRPHRASGDLACHVLDVMLALTESAETGVYGVIDRGCERPEPLAPGHALNALL